MIKRVILSVVAVIALAGAAVNLQAQDTARVDAKHYTLAFGERSGQSAESALRPR